MQRDPDSTLATLFMPVFYAIAWAKRGYAVNNSASYSDFFNGFALEKVIKCCPAMSQTHCNIISAMGNKAAGSDLYCFKISYPQLAKATNTSISTVRRAIECAVKSGVLSKKHTTDSAKMKGCNLYQFTRKFLHTVKRVAEVCKEQEVSIFHESSALRRVARFVFGGLTLPKFGTAHGEQSRTAHGEQTKDKTSKHTVKKETLSPVSPADVLPEQVDVLQKVIADEPVPTVTHAELISSFAAAKARNVKRKSARNHAAKIKLNETATNLAKKFAFLQGIAKRKTEAKRDPMAIGDFSGYEGVGTVNEAFERAKLNGYVSEFENKDYSITLPGFRGA